MGAYYFSRCHTDERFTTERLYPLPDGGNKRFVWDWDRRLSFDVLVRNEEVEREFVLRSIKKFVNDLPADVVQVEIDSKDGALLSRSSDPANDRALVPFYPPRTDFPRRVATVRRGDLTEVGRLGAQVDLATYSPLASPGETRQVVFKYYIDQDNVAISWHEANCVMRMPRHPNIVPFDALVVDTVGGVDRVVGFTTRYIPGGNLSENKDRVFKLKYLEELINVSDYSLFYVPYARPADYRMPPNRLSIISISAWELSMAKYALGNFSLNPRQIPFSYAILAGVPNWAGREI